MVSDGSSGELWAATRLLGPQSHRRRKTRLDVEVAVSDGGYPSTRDRLGLRSSRGDVLQHQLIQAQL